MDDKVGIEVAGSDLKPEEVKVDLKDLEPKPGEAGYVAPAPGAAKPAPAAAAPAAEEETVIEVELEGEEPKPGEEKPAETEEQKKERSRMITRKRFDEQNKQVNDLKKELAAIRESFTVSQSEQYKRERADKKQRMIAEGREDADVERELKQDDNERKISVLEQRLSAAETRVATTDEVVISEEFRATLSDLDKRAMEVCKEQFIAKLKTTRKEHWNNPEMQRDVLDIIKGQNIDKLQVKPDSTNKQIAELTAGSGGPAPVQKKVIKVKLTREQADFCKNNNIDPKKYAADQLKTGNANTMEILPEQSINE